MKREKQIDEMKLIIDKAEEEYSEIWNEWFYDHKEGTKIDNEFLFFAKLLYDAGYRKASEVAEEIFEDIQKIIVHRVLHNENYSFEGVMDSITNDLDELKKKYTEGEG